MKTTNLSIRIFEKQKCEFENINTIRDGVTKKLLEKYKPKGLGGIVNIINRESLEESGMRSWIKVQDLGMDSPIYTTRRKKD